MSFLFDFLVPEERSVTGKDICHWKAILSLERNSVTGKETVTGKKIFETENCFLGYECLRCFYAEASTEYNSKYIRDCLDS